MSDIRGRKAFKVFNQEFVVDERYHVTKELGQGAYGIVCAAQNTTSNDGVAIKKITNVFSKKILAKRALREIKLLQHFRGHRNITCLYDMDIPRPDTFNEAYLYEELMEADLAAIIRSGQPLTDAHFQSFIYQILCGLKYIHSANVLHRDLKPGNLLVNADCELKIADFGLARGFSVDPDENNGYMTEYVATRWYRAPEIMLSFQSYTKASKCSSSVYRRVICADNSFHSRRLVRRLYFGRASRRQAILQGSGLRRPTQSDPPLPRNARRIHTLPYRFTAGTRIRSQSATHAEYPVPEAFPACQP